MVLWGGGAKQVIFDVGFVKGIRTCFLLSAMNT